MSMNASIVLDVRVIGIQQEKIISQNIFVTQVSGLHHYKRKKFFFLNTVTYLGRFRCGHPWWNRRYPDHSFSVSSSGEATSCVRNGVVNKHVSRSGKTKIYTSRVDR
jgi:hypothetical protein